MKGHVVLPLGNRAGHESGAKRLGTTVDFHVAEIKSAIVIAYRAWETRRWNIADGEMQEIIAANQQYP
ncbi:MAG: hypothetical protein JJU36_02565 [Phycisphaeraceae bacterium]|nr:hypothetical protein [Phycisphaeraceae bacterium]